MTVWSDRVREQILRNLNDTYDMSEFVDGGGHVPRHKNTVRNGFAGRMNKHSGFLSRDTRGKSIDLDRDQWSRVYNSYEGSGQ